LAEQAIRFISVESEILPSEFANLVERMQAGNAKAGTAPAQENEGHPLGGEADHPLDDLIHVGVAFDQVVVVEDKGGWLIVELAELARELLDGRLFHRLTPACLAEYRRGGGCELRNRLPAGGDEVMEKGQPIPVRLV